MKKFFAQCYIWLLLIVLYAPIVFIAVFSFTESKVLGNWTGFSTKLYTNLFTGDMQGTGSLMSAIENTLVIALVAAADLGATPWQVFWKVQVPLSMPGVISGVMMVFMPTVSTFAISEFLTNNKIKLFGTIIQENINSSMWNYGAALSLVMLVIIGITSLLQDNKKEVSGGIV